jgi:hypothetical protein
MINSMTRLASGPKRLPGDGVRPDAGGQRKRTGQKRQDDKEATPCTNWKRCLGIGGGLLKVPAIVVLGGVPMAIAVGSSFR